MTYFHVYDQHYLGLFLWENIFKLTKLRVAWIKINVMQKWTEFKDTALHYANYIIRNIKLTNPSAEDSHPFLSG